jgi:hypothetical protein
VSKNSFFKNIFKKKNQEEKVFVYLVGEEIKIYNVEYKDIESYKLIKQIEPSKIKWAEIFKSEVLTGANISVISDARMLDDEKDRISESEEIKTMRKNHNEKLIGKDDMSKEKEEVKEVEVVNQVNQEVQENGQEETVDPTITNDGKKEEKKVEKKDDEVNPVNQEVQENGQEETVDPTITNDGKKEEKKVEKKDDEVNPVNQEVQENGQEETVDPTITNDGKKEELDNIEEEKKVEVKDKILQLKDKILQLKDVKKLYLQFGINNAQIIDDQKIIFNVQSNNKKTCVLEAQYDEDHNVTELKIDKNFDKKDEVVNFLKNCIKEKEEVKKEEVKVEVVNQVNQEEPKKEEKKVEEVVNPVNPVNPVNQEVEEKKEEVVNQEEEKQIIVEEPKKEEKKVESKFRKSTILSAGLFTTGLVGGLAGFGLTAAALATTIVSFIKEAKDWLIEKSDLFKPFFEFLSQQPWLAPVVTAVAAFASSIIALIGAAVPTITGVHSHQEFNKKANELPDGENKTNLLNKNVLHKMTHFVDATAPKVANEGQSMQ